MKTATITIPITYDTTCYGLLWLTAMIVHYEVSKLSHGRLRFECYENLFHWRVCLAEYRSGSYSQPESGMVMMRRTRRLRDYSPMPWVNPDQAVSGESPRC
jgi:hypothetical protein